MRCKAKVLARFPSARLVVCERWPDDGKPRYYRVIAGATYAADTLFLDIYDPRDGYGQGATAAWRSAHAWMKRNPDVVPQRNPPEVVHRVTVDEIFDNPTGWMTGKRK